MAWGAWGYERTMEIVGVKRYMYVSSATWTEVPLMVQYDVISLQNPGTLAGSVSASQPRSKYMYNCYNILSTVVPLMRCRLHT